MIRDRAGNDPENITVKSLVERAKARRPRSYPGDDWPQIEGGGATGVKDVVVWGGGTTAGLFCAPTQQQTTGYY